MPQALDELTQKEREALRLLLAGHDAKSAALALDISVHTLNDRLRAARRKLGVSTSKEAARLLADAEQPTPESFVHKPLGVQENEQNEEVRVAADRSESGIIPFAARRKGLLIMSFAFVASLAALALVPAQAPEAPQGSASSDQVFVAKKPSASELKARRFVGLIDFGKFDESYAEASDMLREQYAPEKWKFGLTLRMTNGKVQKRTLATEMLTDEFRGKADGDFSVITFATMFENDNLRTERVVLEKSDGEWKVADYEILPAQNRLK